MFPSGIFNEKNISCNQHALSSTYYHLYPSQEHLQSDSTKINAVTGLKPQLQQNDNWSALLCMHSDKMSGSRKLTY
jgi:hypothetical protein